jgi:hypothetical protein
MGHYLHKIFTLSVFDTVQDCRYNIQDLFQSRLGTADYALVTSSLHYNDSLVTWTLIYMTAAKFKLLIFFVSGFALFNVANIFIFMILDDFCFSCTDTKVKVKSKSHCDWRSVSQYILVSSPIWDFWPEIFFTKLLSCLFGAPSLTRGRVCHVLVFVIEVYNSQSLFTTIYIWIKIYIVLNTFKKKIKYLQYIQSPTPSSKRVYKSNAAEIICES